MEREREARRRAVFARAQIGTETGVPQLDAVKIDDDGGGSSYGRFNIFGGFMPDDFVHFAVAGAA